MNTSVTKEQARTRRERMGGPDKGPFHVSPCPAAVRASNIQPARFGVYTVKASSARMMVIERNGMAKELAVF